jgi:hypothetical protein
MSRDSQCRPLTHNNKKYFNYHRENVDETTFPEQKHLKTYSRICIVPSAKRMANLIGEQIDWQLERTEELLRSMWQTYPNFSDV